MARVGAVMAKDDDVHSGLRLIDGHDANRGFVDASGNGDGVVLPNAINLALAVEANDAVMMDAEVAVNCADGDTDASRAGGS